MKTSFVFAAAAATLLTASAAQALVVTPMVEYTATSTLSDSRPFTLGYSFSLSSAYTFNAMGIWNDGLGANQQVGLWDAAGTLITSTTVLGSDPLVGNFRWASIASTTIGAGRYVIGGEFLGNGAPLPFQASGISSIPQYSYITDLQIVGAGLNFPTVDTNGSYGANGILYANLGSNVPEPGTWAMMLFGFGGLGVAMRSRRRVTVAA